MIETNVQWELTSEKNIRGNADSFMSNWAKKSCIMGLIVIMDAFDERNHYASLILYEDAEVGIVLAAIKLVIQSVTVIGEDTGLLV